VYNTAGTYTITLTASNVDGSTDALKKTITVVDGFTVQFSTEIIDSNYPPVEVDLTNATAGVGLNYSWTFEGGTPATSTEQHPDNVVFETPGEHTITLEVSNGFESFTKTTTIEVAPDIEAIFDWEVDFKDDDYQAPVTINMTNSSISATSYTWTFPSGSPVSSTEETPTVTFNTPGTYTITLEAGNGKQTHTATKEITIQPNTNIRTFESVELGINTAHNNNVISPDEVHSNGFNPISDTTHTKFINSQEICNCDASLSVAQFDAMDDDTLLEALTITETPNGLLKFDNSLLPRVVLLETANGRKGAIKIKGYVDEGLNSYIICDIKIQKE
jgi:PKD repeat protein